MMSGQNDESAPEAGHPLQPQNGKKIYNGSSVQPWELILVSLLVMAMIGGATTAIILCTRDDPPPPGTAIDPLTGKLISTYRFPTPPPPTLFAGDKEEYEFLLTELSARGDVFDPIVAALPPTFADLAKTASTTTTNPMVRAAVWLTTTDTTNAKEVALIRFALASFYYALSGDQWANKSNWLSSSNGHCDWHGVDCCPALPGSTTCSNTDFDKLIQLDLSQNNLVGTIPISLGLLRDLHSILLYKNQITGTLPGTAIGALPQLHRLYLQHNKLTGSIPSRVAIDTSGLIDTLMLQGNDFSGNMTDDWCDGSCTIVDCIHTGLTEIGVDCDKLDYYPVCVADGYHRFCFYHSQLGTD